MPWNQTDAMKERLKMIGEHASGDYGPSELARRYGVSRKTVYEWIARYEAEGIDGLKERSRAPHQHPNATAQEVVDEILRLKAQWPHWGAPKLLARLQRDMQQAFDLSPTIRGLARQGFPAINVGHTPQALEIYAFVPGVDPASIEALLPSRS